MNLQQQEELEISKSIILLPIWFQIQYIYVAWTNNLLIERLYFKESRHWCRADFTQVDQDFWGFQAIQAVASRCKFSYTQQGFYEGIKRKKKNWIRK